ncbi:MAG: DUF1064 domain-containing protein [Peptoniphilaceae bacterium]
MYSKYKAKKTKVDGITFDSRKEANRYKELKLLERAGVIKSLELQPKFLLQEEYIKDGKTIKEITYKADFMYYDGEKNKVVIEDVKGFKTDVYRLKKKLFEYKYKNLKIMEV